MRTILNVLGVVDLMISLLDSDIILFIWIVNSLMWMNSYFNQVKK